MAHDLRLRLDERLNVSSCGVNSYTSFLFVSAKTDIAILEYKEERPDKASVRSVIHRANAFVRS